MTREEVIRGLELCGYIEGMPQCESCPYDGKACWKRLKNDALAVIKGEEPISASITDSDGGLMHWWACGACKAPINPEDNYCHECGRKVRWEETRPDA